MFKKKDSLTGIGLILFCIALAVVIIIDSQGKERRIHAWAEQQGYEIVAIEEQQFTTGPFQNKDDTQKIYRARVKGKDNQDKWIWFRIGWWLDAKEE